MLVIVASILLLQLLTLPFQACAQGMPDEGDVRLLDRSTVANWVTGRPQIFLEGEWQQICTAGFDRGEAAVVCGQLGFGAGTVLPLFNTLLEDPGPGNFAPVGIVAPNCDGTEATLLDCEGPEYIGPPFFDRFSSNSGCRDRFSNGLRMACVATDEPGEENALRLVGGEVSEESAYGLAEIFSTGAWGTFCEDISFSQDYRVQTVSATYNSVAGTAACVALGFSDGFFDSASNTNIDLSDIRPPWISALRCSDTRPFQWCLNIPENQDTGGCGVPMALFCSSEAARSRDGEVRLVGGRAYPEGRWEYGRLEVRDQGFYTGLVDQSRETFVRQLFVTNVLGPRGAQVACRQLGYTTGGEVNTGAESALPGPAGVTEILSSVVCNGSETRLGECVLQRELLFPVCSPRDDCNVALVCTSPSGCTSPVAPPQPGDVRLVPLVDAAAETAACDAVHFGGVEIFNRGRWGAVCAPGQPGPDGDFTQTPQVICRQLGLPFGSMYEVVMASRSFYDLTTPASNDDRPSNITWVSAPECSGAEQRLEECGLSDSADGTVAGLPEAGVRCFSILGVMCHRFELGEASTSLPLPGPPPGAPPTNTSPASQQPQTMARGTAASRPVRTRRGSRTPARDTSPPHHARGLRADRRSPNCTERRNCSKY